jgi:preprotein translocase subunit SecF
MQDDKDINITIPPTPAEESAVQDELASASPTDAQTSEKKSDASVDEKIDNDLTENSQIEANLQDPTAKTLEEIMEEEAHESETQPPSNFSLSRTLGGAILAHVIQSQIKLVLLITLFLIIYITCRYQCQQKMVEIDRLEQQLTSIRYKATVVTSFLTEKSRESNIMDMLEQKGDSTLQIPKDPPYKINIPE